ncbi:AAA family ATPase [Prevotella fusca]|uniref:ATP-binding protein n=1 Tax=Prevotella fusca JCM 17724 TaxID=1236517 RepID=A0A0K1NMX5_9BACT|nr:ATP-binding protein [Prevotella fusca]AKU70434.1 RloA [Prevotella fusca JCM 17724]QUB86065.1 ATP-binding protein [Prevotella fusca JCM 17724]
MLLRVILKNFLSFEDEVQFDMFPNMKRTSLPDHISKAAGVLPVLRMAAIYGANGAGKSNMLKGVEFIKSLVTDKEFLNQSEVSRYFYALRKESDSQPIELAIEFVTEIGKAYLYSVEIAKDGIKSEILKESGLGFKENRDVFTRDGESLFFAVKPSDEVERMIRGWLEKNPFASLLTINDDMPVLTDEHIAIAKRWFHEELVLIGLNTICPTLIEIFRKNEDINKFASDLFKVVDLGINEVKVQTEDFDDWIRAHNETDVPIERLKNMQSGAISTFDKNRNIRNVVIEEGVRKVSQLMFEQFGKNGFSKDMDIMAQSDGTVRLLTLVPAFYDAIKLGKTVLIDELDHSVHPHLIRELVKYFSRQETTGQLIFTTHQTCLLNQDFIRTDEVWMVEKKEGSTRMYSLNEFKIHNTIKIENGYMEGRYGAIPFIGELNM